MLTGPLAAAHRLLELGQPCLDAHLWQPAQQLQPLLDSHHSLYSSNQQQHASTALQEMTDLSSAGPEFRRVAFGSTFNKTLS
jgi:hypothetical protein